MIECGEIKCVLTAGTGPFILQYNLPFLLKPLETLIREQGHKCFLFEEEGLITFPTRRRYHDRDDIWIIRDSARQLVGIADNCGFDKIEVPRIDLTFEWKYVRNYLADILDNRFQLL